MIALLNWRVWAAVALAVALAASHWKAYHLGGASCREEMAVLNSQMTNEALAASEANRKTEQANSAKLRKAQDDYAKLQKTNADNATALERVRGDFQTALDSRCNQNPSAPGCSDGSGRLERELFGNCATALSKLAGEADRLEAKTLGLQEYIKAIGLDK